MTDFQVVVWGPEESEGTADTLKKFVRTSSQPSSRALHIVPKTSVCVMDVFRTEYKTILFGCNPKLDYNPIKMGKYPFASDCHQ